jgi:hypothetical protein
VIDGDGDKEEYGEGEPCGWEGASLKVDPDERNQCGDEKKTEVAEADVNGFQMLNVELTGLEPLPVVL